MMSEARKRAPLLRDVSVDFTLNLAATLLSTGTMQLLLYPRLAFVLGSVDYGTMLTIIGAVNVITLALGNNLASVRLVREQIYKRAGVKGDFQALLAISSIVSGVLSALVCLVFDIAALDAISVVILTITTVIKSYYIVTFRLILDYKKNLYANIALCIGYVLGAWFLLGRLPWAWAFTLANVLCVIYIAHASNIIRESWDITPQLRSTSKAYALLVSGGLLGNLTTYLDRFVVYPLLGAVSVSTYSVATYFSKGFTLVFSPLTGVLLTYFTQGKVRLTRRSFTFVNVAIILGTFVFVLVCISFGSWITAALYPTLFESARPYILLATVGTAINIASSFNGTVVLALASPIWQTITPAFSLVVYFIVTVCLAEQFGLYGVCVAAIASNLIRFVLNVCVGWSALSESESRVE